MTTKELREFFSSLQRLLSKAPERFDTLSDADARVLDEAMSVFVRLQADRLTRTESHTGHTEDDLGLTGSSEAIRTLRKTIRSVARSSASVLITGENGTGKERVASALFSSSERKNAPFVALNCGALAEGVLESELFGHVRGAFTGASNAHDGVFARADGGTLFLDEIGDTSPATQVKLLRVLQEGTFTPVGGKLERRVNVRVIAATNRDLESMRKQGSFRDDLYFRLAVVRIAVPPLRNRKEDIPALVQSFIDREKERDGHGIARTTTNELLTLFAENSWPGNVRELENAVRRLIALSGDSKVLHTRLLEQINPPSTATASGRDLTRGIQTLVFELERQIVRQALEQCGTMSNAARLLRLTQPGLRAKMERLGIDVPVSPAKAG
jgi:two-component system response regulator HupR/HoxA